MSTQVGTVPWGSGSERRISAAVSPSHGDESWYFDAEGRLVAAVFTYPSGLPLAAYPTLRETLSHLKSARDFYLSVAKLPTKGQMDISRVYQTGDEKTTTQYLVTGIPDTPTLLMATFAIDPYVQLFTPNRKEFLDRFRGPEREKAPQGTVDQLPYPALQEFSRGEAALLAYCGTRAPQVAVQAYQRAIDNGLSKDPVRLAEAHHKLGLAWEGSGDLEKAKSEMEQALALRPNAPEIINNLGTIAAQTGRRDQAIAWFQKAVTIRPNYPLARYNLAEALEPSNRKVAISEYETYLALVEGNPDEATRATLVKKKLKEMQR
ncbi:MAG: tetratricopeptide repeat protein [Nitrospiraceae bacterium]